MIGEFTRVPLAEIRARLEAIAIGLDDQIFELRITVAIEIRLVFIGIQCTVVRFIQYRIVIIIGITDITESV